jgi:hypothetical protein
VRVSANKFLCRPSGLMLACKCKAEALMGNDARSVGSAVPRSTRREKAVASAYIASARKQYTTSTDSLEIDDEPQVSIADGGAWVTAWVWVAQVQVPLRKERQVRALKS